jgi:hypothetical protein
MQNLTFRQGRMASPRLGVPMCEGKRVFSSSSPMQITHLKCACHMWNTLLHTFNMKAAAKPMSFHRETRLFTMRPGEKPYDYVLRARRISTSLRSLGERMSEISLCSMILEGLSDDYETDKRLQLSVCNYNPNIHQLQHVLELTYMSLEARKNNVPAPRPFRNQGGAAQPVDKGRQGGSSQPAGAHQAEVPKGTKDVHADTGTPAFQHQGRSVQVCTYCKKVGHLKNWCPKLNAEERGVQSNCIQRENVVSQPSLPGLLIDSGSIDHISPSCENMIDYVKFDVPQRLVVANGKTEDIVGEGTMQVFLESGCSLLLHNVKHVPSSKKYPLSVGKAYLDGINVNILEIECYLTDSSGYNLGYAEHVFPYQWLVDLSLPDKHVSFHPETKFVESCNVQVAQADLWHQRLGHLSPHNLMRMRKGCMVKGMKVPPTDLSKMIGNAALPSGRGFGKRLSET